MSRLTEKLAKPVIHVANAFKNKVVLASSLLVIGVACASGVATENRPPENKPATCEPYDPAINQEKIAKSETFMCGTTITKQLCAPKIEVEDRNLCGLGTGECYSFDQEKFPPTGSAIIGPFKVFSYGYDQRSPGLSRFIGEIELRMDLADHRIL